MLAEIDSLLVGGAVFENNEDVINHFDLFGPIARHHFDRLPFLFCNNLVFFFLDFELLVQILELFLLLEEFGVLVLASSQLALYRIDLNLRLLHLLNLHDFWLGS